MRVAVVHACLVLGLCASACRAVDNTATAASAAPAPPPPPINVQTLSCLGSTSPLAPNQGWVARPVAAAAAPPANLSCPLTAQRRCYSGSDLLPAGMGNQTLASCCALCHRTAGCVGIVLTTRPGTGTCRALT